MYSVFDQLGIRNYQVYNVLSYNGTTGIKAFSLTIGHLRHVFKEFHHTLNIFKTSSTTNNKEKVTTTGISP